MCDQYFGFHATSHGTTQGNGLYVLENPWSDHPAARNLLADSVVESGARKGQKLGNGGYLSPDVSYDGRQILFAYTDGEPQIRVWNEHTTFHIFRCNADGTGLVQLTDGCVNDFDPCWLPNGRIVFISERRGGFGRCHGARCRPSRCTRCSRMARTSCV
jgi:dipeptidyl aminopeptidase/acylaminoacyl peptidase